MNRGLGVVRLTIAVCLSGVSTLFTQVAMSTENVSFGAADFSMFSV